MTRVTPILKKFRTGDDVTLSTCLFYEDGALYFLWLWQQEKEDIWPLSWKRQSVSPRTMLRPEEPRCLLAQLENEEKISTKRKESQSDRRPIVDSKCIDFSIFAPFFFLRNKKYSWRIVAARGHWLVTQSFGIPAGIGTDTKTRWAASLTGRQRIVHSAGESSSFLINFVSVALFLCRSDYLNLIWSNVRRNWGLCVIATGVSRSEYSKRWK